MGSGSTVLARQNPFLYTLILIIVVSVVVASVLGVIIIRVREKHKSQSWIDSHKDLPTNKKNVRNMAKIANLTGEEANLLWAICHAFKTKNIEYLYKDYDAINDLFKAEYDNLIERNQSEEKKSLFFSLRYKMEKAHDIATYITSSTNIQEGQVITMTDKAGNPWSLTIISNTKQGFFVELPPPLASSENKYPPLEKITIQFSTKTNISYSLDTRIVRYDIGKNGKQLMLCSQTNILKPLQRRMAKRMDIDMDCKFSAVKGDNKKKAGYQILENRYPGKMSDISPTGCSLICGLPIKHGQLIYVEFSMEDRKITAIGEIVSTQRMLEQKKFILHIKFTQIQLDLQNIIYASIYGYMN